METKHTRGPWAWQKFGNDWSLTGQHGMRPIVLTVRKGKLTSLVNGLLAPLDPQHPDAALIASAPDLLAENARLRAALTRAKDHLIMSEGHFVVDGKVGQSNDWKEALDQARAALERKD